MSTQPFELTHGGGLPIDGTHPIPVAGVFADSNGVPYSTANPLPVNVGDLTVQNLTVSFPSSVVSTVNSTSALLGAGGVFTGVFEDASKFSAISVIVLTDQASAVNGAVVDFSPDGVVVSRSVTATVPGNVGLTFMFAPEARYFRIRYTNGATVQTLFRAQTQLHYQTPAAPQLPLAATTTDVSLAQSTMAHVRGRASTGQWLPVAVTASGAVVVDGSGATQPVSLASVPLPAGAAKDSTLTDGSQRATVTVANPTANPETGLAKDATFAKDADGGIKTHVQNFPATQPVSAAALPLPAGASKDSTLTDGSQRLGGTVTTTTTNGTATGTLTALNQAVTLTVPDGHSSWTVTLGGTFSATSQVAFEFSEDNTTWFAANGRRNLDSNTNDTTSLLDANPVGGPAPTGANPSHWRGSAGGVKYLRVRCAAFTASDAIAVTIVTSAGVGTTFLNSPTPPVANYAAAGSLTALNDAVTIACLGMSGYSAVVTGTWTGTLTLEATVDGTTWNPINGAVQGVGTLSTTVTANTQVRGSLGGLKQFRVRLSTLGSGTANVAITAGAGAAGVFLTAPVPIAALTGVVTNRQAVTTTAARVDAGFARTSVEVKALAANTAPVYVGFSSGVTVATGRELSAGEAWSVDIGPTIGVYAVAASAQAVQVTETG